MEHRSARISASSMKPKPFIALATATIAIAMAALLCMAAPADALASEGISLTTAAAKTLKVGKPKSLKVKAGAERMTITFKKGANGTQSQVAYKKAGAKKWTVIAVGAKTKVTIKKLTGNTKYSVKVRSYAKVGKKTIRGAWSTAKTATPRINSKLIGNWRLYSMKATGDEQAPLQQELLDALGISFTQEALDAIAQIAAAQNAEIPPSLEELLGVLGIDPSFNVGEGELNPTQKALIDTLTKEITTAIDNRELTPTLMAYIRTSGGNLTLDVKGNGKAVLQLIGSEDNPYLASSKTKWNLTWQKKTVKTGTLKLKDYAKPIPIKMRGDKLVMETGGAEAVFAKA